MTPIVPHRPDSDGKVELAKLAELFKATVPPRPIAGLALRTIEPADGPAALDFDVGQRLPDFYANTPARQGAIVTAILDHGDSYFVVMAVGSQVLDDHIFIERTATPTYFDEIDSLIDEDKRLGHYEPDDGGNDG